MIAILHAIFLGIIEGLTEFLPISSTGHLLLSEKLIGYKDSARIFTVVIQIGAIAAVIWFYRQDLYKRVRGLIARKRSDITFWKNLVIATIPAAVIGLVVDKLLGTNDLIVVIAFALIIGGFIMLHAENTFEKRHVNNNENIDLISPRQAFAVGCVQVLALIPGVSRSGATIIGGMYAGLNRVTATAFSFYLSIPVLVLAGTYKLVKGREDLATISGGGGALIAGLVAAFITALFAIRWLLKYVAHHDFKPFAYYRIALGFIILVFFNK